jgi:hypothetical protein
MAVAATTSERLPPIRQIMARRIQQCPLASGVASFGRTLNDAAYLIEQCLICAACARIQFSGGGENAANAPTHAWPRS